MFHTNPRAAVLSHASTYAGDNAPTIHYEETMLTFSSSRFLQKRTIEIFPNLPKSKPYPSGS